MEQESKKIKPSENQCQNHHLEELKYSDDSDQNLLDNLEQSVIRNKKFSFRKTPYNKNGDQMTDFSFGQFAKNSEESSVKRSKQYKEENLKFSFKNQLLNQSKHQDHIERKKLQENQLDNETGIRECLIQKPGGQSKESQSIVNQNQVLKIGQNHRVFSNLQNKSSGLLTERFSTQMPQSQIKSVFVQTTTEKEIQKPNGCEREYNPKNSQGFKKLRRKNKEEFEKQIKSLEFYRRLLLIDLMQRMQVCSDRLAQLIVRNENQRVRIYIDQMFMIKKELEMEKILLENDNFEDFAKQFFQFVQKQFEQLDLKQIIQDNFKERIFNRKIILVSILEWELKIDQHLADESILLFNGKFGVQLQGNKSLSQAKAQEEHIENSSKRRKMRQNGRLRGLQDQNSDRNFQASDSISNSKEISNSSNKILKKSEFEKKIDSINDYIELARIKLNGEIKKSECQGYCINLFKELSYLNNKISDSANYSLFERIILVKNIENAQQQITKLQQFQLDVFQIIQKIALPQLTIKTIESLYSQMAKKLSLIEQRSNFLDPYEEYIKFLKSPNRIRKSSRQTLSVNHESNIRQTNFMKFLGLNSEEPKIETQNIGHQQVDDDKFRQPMLEEPRNDNANSNIQSLTQQRQSEIKCELVQSPPTRKIRAEQQMKVLDSRGRQQEKRFGKILNSSEKKRRKLIHESSKQSGMFGSYLAKNNSTQRSLKSINFSDQTLTQQRFDNQISKINQLISQVRQDVKNLVETLKNNQIFSQNLSKLDRLMNQIAYLKRFADFQRDIFIKNMEIAKHQISQIQRCRDKQNLRNDEFAVPSIFQDLKKTIDKFTDDRELMKKSKQSSNQNLQPHQNIDNSSPFFGSPNENGRILQIDSQSVQNVGTFSQLQRQIRDSSNQFLSQSGQAPNQIEKYPEKNIQLKTIQFKVVEQPAPARQPVQKNINQSKILLRRRLDYSFKNFDLTIKPNQNFAPIKKPKKLQDGIENLLENTAAIQVQKQARKKKTIKSFNKSENDYYQEILNEIIPKNKKLFQIIKIISNNEHEMKLRLIDYRNSYLISYTSLCLSQNPQNLPERIELLRKRDQQILDYFSKKGIRIEPSPLQITENFLQSIKRIAEGNKRSPQLLELIW